MPILLDKSGGGLYMRASFGTRETSGRLMAAWVACTAVP